MASALSSISRRDRLLPATSPLIAATMTSPITSATISSTSVRPCWRRAGNGLLFMLSSLHGLGQVWHEHAHCHASAQACTEVEVTRAEVLSRGGVGIRLGTGRDA